MIRVKNHEQEFQNDNIVYACMKQEMETFMKLSEIDVYTKAVIRHVQMEDKDKRRLFFMGLYEGAAIMKLQAAPMRDPALYFVLGNQIILRNKDAKFIEVEVRE